MQTIQYGSSKLIIVLGASLTMTNVAAIVGKECELMD
jgi:hypothetical protein